MRANLRHAVFLPMTVVVILAAAALPLGALAEEATPPPPGEGPISSPVPVWDLPTPTPTATLIPPTADPGFVDSGTVAMPDPALPPTAVLPGPAWEEPPADATGDEPALLEQLPPETTLIVLDEGGKELPLGSTEAALVLAVGDPIWCPAGVPPIPGSGGCTGTYGKLEDLIAALSGGAQPNKDGTIWITGGLDASSGPIIIDGSILTTWKDYALTVQGGWDGTSAGTIIGETTFTVPIQIIGWEDDISLNDLIVDSTTADGITVTTSGDILLDDVESKDNNGRGAYLDNTSGGAAARIAVGESSFHDNLTGLDMYTFGDVSLVYVEASHNDGIGVLVEDARSVSIFHGDFSWNGFEGLNILADQDVLLADVDARHNGGDGAQIFSGHDLTITGAVFDQNDGYGLFADANHLISLTGVDARENEASGMFLSAGRDATLIDVSSSWNGGAGGLVFADWNILVDRSAFEHNQLDGVFVDSLNGDIMVSCSSLTYNNGYGVDAVLPGQLELNGDTFFANNGGDYRVSGEGAASIGLDPDCDPNAEETPVPTSTPDTRGTLNVVHVIDGQIVTLDCVSYRGTVLVLSNGDQVILECPVTGQASLSRVTKEDLPSALADGLTQVSALEVDVTPSLDGVILVDFVIPAGTDETKLSILRWTETDWVDLRGVKTEEGYFEALSSLDGVFVLVSE